jgi:hypothetical protein
LKRFLDSLLQKSGKLRGLVRDLRENYAGAASTNQSLDQSDVHDIYDISIMHGYIYKTNLQLNAMVFIIALLYKNQIHSNSVQIEQKNFLSKFRSLVVN